MKFSHADFSKYKLKKNHKHLKTITVFLGRFLLFKFCRRKHFFKLNFKFQAKHSKYSSNKL